MTALCTLQTQFETRLPAILKIAHYQFRGLRPEAKDEAVANTLGLCWKKFIRLAEQGKHDDDAVFNSMVFHATRHTHQRRQPQTKGRARDALDYAKKGVVGRDADFNLNSFVDDSTPVPDAVAYRIDVPQFLSTLTDRQRALAIDLAEGMSTKEAADKHGVTPSAVSQFRTRFLKLWEAYQASAN